VIPPHLDVRLTGELDAHTVARLEALSRLDYHDVSTVRMDLGRLTFCDSTGLRGLVHLRSAQTQAGRTFRIVRVHPRVLRVLELTHTASLFLG
jgi:anti-sigma B factor antagonist